ncbi:hypothetical protein QF026_004857 [Streptomyces aurantiacus]|uniref:hypothetical protein n=1 Tax=Streptomyces aurantiacus TaxID=47760 RepID=UPI00278E206A|nr:hypothetical protein [Streptomyces aurantiacus]MDQ0776391.1 hypothetical protein [Streptomyces aurantiacus]
MPPPLSQPTSERRPRAMVIDKAWRGLGPGLDSLSGPGGAPLTRTVKLIVLPLVVRPSLHPELAADFLDPHQAARLEALIREAGARLVATAQWFTLLKKTRRALGIVAGNPQDLYFQLCFELATEHNEPSNGAEAVARAALLEVANAAGGRTVEALKDHLADDVRRSWLDGDLAAAWESRQTAPAGDADVAARAAAQAAASVLEACGAPGPERDSASFEAMVEGGHGSLLGRALWARAGGGVSGAGPGGVSGGVWGRDDLPAHLKLTEHRVPPRPEVGRGASTATLPAPLDRTLFERLFVVLQSSVRREELPTVPELVRREVGRSCAPLGLHDESLRVAVVLGGRLAVGLDPLGNGDSAPGRTAAHRAVNSRWQREASVLRARRMTLSPRPDPDGGVLDALARDLRTPWVAYMRRLWVRLHGRDVRDAPLNDMASAWALLDGVARSVMMDHRARVRSALRTLSPTAAPTAVLAAEQRSS